MTNKFILRVAQALCLLAMVVCFTACEKDKEEDLEGSYAKFVDVRVTHCERVGSVLTIDYTITNKQNYEVTVTLYGPKVSDNAGNNYTDAMGIVSILSGGDTYYQRSEFSLRPKASIEGHAKVKDFDTQNRSKSVRFEMEVTIGGETLENHTFSSNNITFADNRVLDHGVQTNDTLLTYDVRSCGFTADGLCLVFAVTNHTGIRLEDFGFGYGYGGEAVVQDNLGNRYSSDIRIGDGQWYHRAGCDLPNGNTVEATLRVRDARETASELNVTIGSQAKNYIFADNKVRFFDIPIERAE